MRLLKDLIKQKLGGEAAAQDPRPRGGGAPVPAPKDPARHSNPREGFSPDAGFGPPCGLSKQF